MNYPDILTVRQIFKTNPIKDIQGRVHTELERIDLPKIIKSNETVAITAGSRGLANIATILAEVVKALKNIGAKPFIVPAMGSHGGATAKGQKQLIARYGITEASMAAPIRSRMDVVQVSQTAGGLPVYMDRYAYEADHIVVVNRVKSHTDFMAPIESGLMKMMVIGLGKQKGADFCHNAVLQQGYSSIIVPVAREILKHCPIAFGLALVENQKDETEIIQAVLPEDFEETEKRLLKKAKKRLPRIPLDRIDLLIVDRMGKEISGTGMDQNVIARSEASFAKTPKRPKIRRIFIRDLTDETHGNAVGIGNADFTTKRLVKKIDRQVTDMNCMTACAPELARVPMIFDTDQQAIDAALKTIGIVKPEEARIVHIVDTLHLETLEISSAMRDDARDLTTIRIIGSPRPISFDPNGHLISNLMEAYS